MRRLGFGKFGDRKQKKSAIVRACATNYSSAAMLFCPHCSNLLLIENEGGQDFYCQTCPYVYSIQKRVSTIEILLQRLQSVADLGIDLAYNSKITTT